MATRAISLDCEWARIYQRLLPRLATHDERTKAYRGKLRAIGRIAGQMASMIFALLKTDQETLSQLPLGQEPPPLMLYDPTIHRKHQEGHYRSLKPGTRPRKIIQLPHFIVVVCCFKESYLNHLRFCWVYRSDVRTLKVTSEQSARKVSSDDIFTWKNRAPSGILPLEVVNCTLHRNAALPEG